MHGSYQLEEGQTLVDIKYENEPTGNGKKYGLYALMLTSVGLGVAAVSNLNNNAAHTSSNLAAARQANKVSMKVSASNEYGDAKEKMFKYPFLEGALLAEPYKTTTFTITDAVSGCGYSWKVSDSDSSVIASGKTDTGAFEVSELTAVGDYTLEITGPDCSSTDDDGSTTDDATQGTFSTTVWVKYVRRELLSLTDDDREKFLDALATLWTTNTVTGQSLYGSKYKSLNFFATIHNDAGANSVCDEFHGGAGFANNHLMIGSYLEQSLQLVDPSVALHYMDYSKYFETEAFERHVTDQMDGGTWTPILSDLWFGSNDPVTGSIIDSRWANMTIPRTTHQFFIDEGVDEYTVWFPTDAENWYHEVDDAHLHSPYGLLRSPWNWNPSPHLARYNNLNRIPDLSGMEGFLTKAYMGVSCSNYQSFGKIIGGKPMSEFLLGLENDVHGAFHFTLGGVGGPHAYEMNQYLKTKYDFTDEDLLHIGETAIFKTSYTHYKTRSPLGNGTPFPFNCTAFPWDRVDQVLTTNDIPGSPDATCWINPFFCESQDNMQLLYDAYFGKFTGNTEQYELVLRMSAMDLDSQCDIMNTLLSRSPYGSEMSGSGAAHDPLFWVAHGALERLFQQVLFSGATSDTDFPDLPGQCSGSAYDGTKFWMKGFDLASGNLLAEEITNAQYTEILDPTSDLYRDEINYVYDVAGYDWCDGWEDWFNQ